MKISIKLTKKEKELYKKGRNYVSLLNEYWCRLVLDGDGWDDGRVDRAFGVKFRKELYKKLKELEA